MFQVAKWVGDLFNGGIYDTHIELKKTPFLEWESPKQLDTLVAGDVISPLSKLSYVYPITRVCCIEKLLCSTKHSAFPVVTPIKASSFPSLLRGGTHFSPQLYSCQSTPSTLSSDQQDVSSDAVRIRSPVMEELRSVGSMSKMSSFEDSYNLPQHERHCE